MNNIGPNDCREVMMIFKGVVLWSGDLKLQTDKQTDGNTSFHLVYLIELTLFFRYIRLFLIYISEHKKR